MQVNRKEIERYLGYHGVSPTATVSLQIENCLTELQRVIHPLSVKMRFPLLHIPSTSGELLQVEDMVIQSRHLSKNLAGCTQVVLFAATLGGGCDRLIHRSSISQISTAAIYQAASAAMIEAYCNEINASISSEALNDNLFCRPRFSPGYGDFSLSFQRDFFRLLKPEKAIGLTLTDSLLMAPSKSVTALVGLSSQKAPCHPAGCEACSISSSCAFSRI